jgi:hypothetical protein
MLSRRGFLRSALGAVAAVITRRPPPKLAPKRILIDFGTAQTTVKVLAPADVGAQGGFLVPEEFHADLLEMMAAPPGTLFCMTRTVLIDDVPRRKRPRHGHRNRHRLKALRSIAA